jgi:stage II sporulation protein P
MKQTILIKTVNIKRLISSILIGIVILFLMASLFVTSMTDTKSYYVHQWFEKFSTEGFIKAIQLENGHFNTKQSLKNNGQTINSLFFSLLTNLRLNDTKSLLVQELTSMSKFDNNILVAGDGTDFTNLPIESSLTLDEINKDPNVDVNKIEEQPIIPTKPPTHTTNGKNVFLIYHTHSWESFLPLIPGATKPNEATSSKVNVSLLGERLRKKLISNGIGAIDDKTNIGSELAKKQWNWKSSYKMSRLVVQDDLENDKNLNYLIDIHRDDARRDVTTQVINGKSYAKLYFVVGVENKNYKKNYEFAKEINKEIEKVDQRLTRGIFSKNYSNGNGVYNQDLSPNSILIEVGGVDNTLPELYRTIDLLGDILAKYYWKAEKVNG